MSIRKTLLIAFLGLSLTSAALFAGLAFVKARSALRSEIERSLAVQASSISSEIDRMMFERLQNAATWSRLDIMQDMQVRDVDKRLSNFLAELENGYRDVYLSLSGIDPAGRVISSSDPALVGSDLPKLTPSISTSVSGMGVELRILRVKNASEVDAQVALPSSFTPNPLGFLRLKLDWNALYDVLDRAGAIDGRLVAVVDEQGRLIGSSSALRNGDLLAADALARWSRTADAVTIQSGEPLFGSDVIVGQATGQGYGSFKGFQWKTLVIQPVGAAYAPVRQMAQIFGALFLVILALTFLIATWVSREVAKPITRLTAFTRGYLRNKVWMESIASAGGEVGELTSAFVQLMRDIEHAQQSLVRASKLAVVGEMSAIIAHEVRTPLGILRSSAQMLRRERALSPEGRELVGFIEDETERLNRLVSAMLDTARPRTTTFAPVDLHELIEKAATMLSAEAGRAGVTIRRHLAASHPVVECDAEQILQVLFNLMTNGLQILSHGGSIEIATGDVGDALRIDVADDGPGIDPEERSKIFEAFFFKREGGIGLGLTIVQQIVIAHHGEIDATQSSAGGALFRILLPRSHVGIA